jgi:hypothetical protein
MATGITQKSKSKSAPTTIMPKKEPVDLAVLAEPIEFMKTLGTKEELEQTFVIADR